MAQDALPGWAKLIMAALNIRHVRLPQADHATELCLRQTTPFSFGSKIKGGRRQGWQSGIEQGELNRDNRYRHGRRLAWLGYVSPVG